MPFKIDLLKRAGEGRAMTVAQARDIARTHWKAPVLGWDLERQRWDFEAGTAAEAIKGIVRAYGDLHERPDPAVWIDHTPMNIRFAATLADAFPDASFVHLVRDGRAAAASMLRTDWGPTSAHAAARFWTERVAQGLAAETGLAGRCVRVRYEDVVARPQETLRALCDGIGIEYHDEMVLGTGFRATPYIQAQHALVGKPPDPTRLDAWKGQLSERDIEIFEAVVGDLLPLLGYEPRFGFHARGVTRKERWTSELEHAVRRRTVDRLRKRTRIRASRG
jgi:hypothetical protein